MRELNECKAEIFRRSENRINRRKKNISRALAFCVPLFLAVTAWSVTLLPTVMYDGINCPCDTDSGNESGLKEGEDGFRPGAAVSADMTDGSEPVSVIDEVSGTKPSESYTSSASDYIKEESSSPERPEIPQPYESSDKPDNTEPPTEDDPLNNFSFSLNWGGSGMNYYNSKTGMLVKKTDSATDPINSTNCRLTFEQTLKIYKLISALEVDSYPDSYNPYGDDPAEFPNYPQSEPIILILSVSCDDTDKTVTADNIFENCESADIKGQAFLGVCKAIEEILTGTEAWNALP